MHFTPITSLTAPPVISLNSLCLEPASFEVLVEMTARLGADAIFADRTDVESFGGSRASRAATDAGLPVAGLTHRAFGFVDAVMMRVQRERLMETIDLAQTLDAGVICLTTGGRGRLSWAEAAVRFVDAIAPCVDAARSAGVALAIEPTSHLYADASIVHRLSDTTALARRADLSVGLDVFPCWVDADLVSAVDDVAPLCAFAQISDHVAGDRSLPCRAVPGDGDVPLDLIVERLIRGGFNGPFDLEIIGPRIVDDRAAKLRRGLARVRASIASALVSA